MWMVDGGWWMVGGGWRVADWSPKLQSVTVRYSPFRYNSKSSEAMVWPAEFGIYRERFRSKESNIFKKKQVGQALWD